MITPSTPPPEPLPPEMVWESKTALEDPLDAHFGAKKERDQRNKDAETSSIEANTPKVAGSGSPPSGNDDPPNDCKDKVTELPYMRSENGLPGRTIPQDEYDRRQGITDQYTAPRPSNAEIAQQIRGDSSSAANKDNSELPENTGSGEKIF